MLASGWYAEIEGLEDLISKLSRLENLKVDDVLETVAEEGTQVLQTNTASAGFPKSSQSVDIHKNKYGGKGVSIGYEGDFDSWKELYYHNFGYNLVYFGKRTNKHITCHVGVWDDIKHLTIQEIQPILEKRLKQRIHEILK